MSADKQGNSIGSVYKGVVEMRVTLDGYDIFAGLDFKIQVGALRRDSVERSVCGLDGIVSIDLGSRGRAIKQKGILNAVSHDDMQRKIDVVNAFIDGCSHRLVTDKGDVFDNLRMDSFKVCAERVSGCEVCCDYEIVYNQLVV